MPQSSLIENNQDGIIDEDNTSNLWRDESIKLLISEYKEKKPLVETGKIKTLKKMWTKISEEMEQYGYKFTPQQIENKWKSLERSYKNMIENKHKTGRGRRFCPYER